MIYRTQVYIGHFGKYYNTLCLSPQILHKHCLFSFSWDLQIWVGGGGGGTNKEYYGIFRNGLLGKVKREFDEYSLFL